jgi:hypothetical protein
MSSGFSGVKIFSATLAEKRASLGDAVTRWLNANPQLEVVDKVVTQSSDEGFHCLSFVLFFRPVSDVALPENAKR